MSILLNLRGPIFFAPLLGLLLSIVSGNHVMSDEPSESEMKLKTQRVIVFKDGYCLVVKEGIATTDESGVAFTDEVPDAAILGSFWAVPETGTIESIVAGWEENEAKTDRKINCTTAIEIIEANLGKQCSFEQGDEKMSGKLIKILANDNLPKLEFPDTESGSLPEMGWRISPTSAHLSAAHSTDASVPSLTLSTVTGAHFVLQTETGDVMVATNSIQNLTIESMTSTRTQTATRKSRHKRLSMKFADANSEVKISLMYFRPDVRWIPTYRVNLTETPFAENKADQENKNKRPGGTKTAELIMQGEILNEAEDFTNVPFHVVVGVPNFRFRSIPSPMVLESSLQNVLAQAAPDIMGNGRGQQFSNALYAQRSSEFRSNRASGDENRSAIALPDELHTSSGNDLFVYELKPMSLKKGERAQVPILQTSVAYRDVYTWNVDVPHAETYAAAGESTSPLVLSENKIWRQVELINDTDIPWTTGAAMFVDGFQPLAQELLTYTSPGGICRVPVTVSVDLRGKIEDSETGRELKALRWRNNDYLRVDGKVEAELANNKQEAVNVEVRMRFGGKSKSVSPDGTVTHHPYRVEDWTNGQGNAINNSTTIKWESKIEPGECFKPDVEYEFFMRY